MSPCPSIRNHPDSPGTNAKVLGNTSECLALRPSFADDWYVGLLEPRVSYAGSLRLPVLGNAICPVDGGTSGKQMASPHAWSSVARVAHQFRDGRAVDEAPCRAVCQQLFAVMDYDAIPVLIHTASPDQATANRGRSLEVEPLNQVSLHIAAAAWSAHGYRYNVRDGWPQ